MFDANLAFVFYRQFVSTEKKILSKVFWLNIKHLQEWNHLFIWTYLEGVWRWFSSQNAVFWHLSTIIWHVSLDVQSCSNSFQINVYMLIDNQLKNQYNWYSEPVYDTFTSLRFFSQTGENANAIIQEIDINYTVFLTDFSNT